MASLKKTHCIRVGVPGVSKLHHPAEKAISLSGSNNINCKNCKYYNHKNYQTKLNKCIWNGVSEFVSVAVLSKV
jgi:hypothetical protein